MFDQEPPSNLRIAAFLLFLAVLGSGVLYVIVQVAQRLIEGK
jgi:hypothetical protein